MHLTSVYERAERHSLLYELLQERDATVSISHKAMPSYDDHFRFVETKPYAAWYFMEQADRVVGACYLSKQDEIGVFVFKAFQGRGFGSEAVVIMMAKHPKDRYLANINPTNEQSAAMFANLGFTLVQHTYARSV